MKFLYIFLFTLAFCLILSGCADGDTPDTDDPSDTSDTVDTTADISSDSETEETEDMTDTDEADTTDTEAPETDETDPPETVEYTEIEGLTVLSEGVVSIDEAQSQRGDRSDPLSRLPSLANDGYNTEGGKYVGKTIDIVHIGDAVISLSPRYSEYTGTLVNFCIESVTAYGHTVVPYVDRYYFYVNFNGYLQAFWADGYFILSKIEPDPGWATTYIFYKDGFTVFPEETGDYMIIFYNENGKLIYERTARKFITNVNQVSGGLFIECVARDEFYKEVGTAEVVNGKVVLTPTETISIDDVFDLEAQWADWCITVEIDPTKTSMDEYLAENAKKYERAE